MTASTNRANILIVDDRPENLVSLEAVLAAPGINIVKAYSGNEALGVMLEYNFAVVLLDVQMPEMDGFEVAELMRQKEKTKFIPIIFVTAISKDEKFIFKGYEIGAVDYLFKPLNPAILRSKINIFLQLNRHKQELENTRIQVEAKNRKLKELSIRDGLTGLYNHRHFHELMNREFFQARRNNYDLSCFMIDLDYFKDVNDTFGHTFGDFVLRQFGRLISSIIRKTDILARYGGEEFILLLPHTQLQGARTLGEKFRKKAENYVYQENNHSKRVTVSIGIATYEEHQPEKPGDLITFADKALYAAKTAGRNRVKVYKESDTNLLDGLKPHPQIPINLFGLQEQLTKVLEKSREFIISSLDQLALHPMLEQHPEEIQKFNRHHNSRSLEILDLMSQRMGLPRQLAQTFKRSAKLHDLFKIYLNDETAMKDGPMDEDEQLNIEDYPFMLDQLARKFDIFEDERSILLYHHENFDGSGYPEGLIGTEVPLGARLFALVDAFVAMTSPRNYRPVLNSDEVVSELLNQSGKQFDPQLVKILLELITEKKLMPLSKNIAKSREKEVGA